MSNIVDVKIDKETVEKIIRTQIQSAVVMQLDGAKDELLRKAVDLVLTTKVDDKGQANRDSYYNKTPYIEWLVQDNLMILTKELLQEYFEKNKEVIQKALVKEITKNKNRMVNAMATAMIEGAMDKYNYKFEVSVKEKPNGY